MGSPASRAAPVLLLLHGLGAHSGVWTPFMEAIRGAWDGRILAPDLPGHGLAPWTGAYGIGQQAAEMASLLVGAGPTTIVAHSMGGLVGLALATGWFGAPVARVLAVGVKVDWSPAERQAAADQASKPVRWFDNREAAAERFLKVSGLSGLAEGAELAERGVVAADGRWRLSADPATPSVGAPDMGRLMAAVACPVRLVRGNSDILVTLQALRGHDPGAVNLPGGHSAHVEHPAALAQLLLSWTAGQ